ncbi:MAG TPA: type I methionyl aminopeptidase [Spirochaetota bacterium]|nr:type I methionyl aminopeptidase [Spirochaetota bacterium]HPF06075.1 type I methionyl aminopeptidase [Spirochaetota bacterium]HPJ43858.1 type I methionyl aminopeptidase [Spirochaetota bacterium]HPR36958.1 type I methionyl aminopeptidase [Spirochaetota bacterium]HRX47329.1 type I methionyl aminopeptidase [Spirochaetota bacterium]
MNRIVRLKNDDDIKRIKECGLIIHSLFKLIQTMNLEGLTTWELDSFIEDYIMKRKARAAFKTVRGYSFASCISVNSVASHGVPSRKLRIKEGDIVKIDTGTVMNGYFADSCITAKIGVISESAERLVDAAYKALFAGINEVYPGKNIGDIGFAVEGYVKSLGYSVVKNFTGHGVGFALHEPPVVPNYGSRGTGHLLREGMVMTVEPIVNEGSDELLVLDDGWTSVTSDGMLSAQFEHTIAITEAGPVLLTSE